MEFPYKKNFINNPDKLFENLKKINFIENKYNYNKFEENGIHDINHINLSVYIEHNDDDYNNIDILSDFFQEKERVICNVKNNDSPYNYWYKNKDKFQNNDKFNNLSIQEQREYIYKNIKECNQFKPSLSLYVAKKLKSTKILDPSAGWGDRLLGALANNDIILYNGFDPNINLKKGHDDMIIKYGNSNFDKYKIIYIPFEKSIINTYDLVFTSPPYFDYEEYKSDNQSYIGKNNIQEWLRDFLYPMLYKSWNSLIDGGFMAIHLNNISKEPMVKYMNEYIQNNLKNSVFYGIIGSKGSSKSIKNIWIWKKNTTNKIIKNDNIMNKILKNDNIINKNIINKNLINKILSDTDKNNIENKLNNKLHENLVNLELNIDLDISPSSDKKEQITIKNFLEKTIFECLDKYKINNKKGHLVITGGSALNYYLINTTSGIIPTSDYDIKLVVVPEYTKNDDILYELNIIRFKIVLGIMNCLKKKLSKTYINKKNNIFGFKSFNKNDDNTKSIEGITNIYPKLGITLGKDNFTLVYLEGGKMFYVNPFTGEEQFKYYEKNKVFKIRIFYMKNGINKSFDLMDIGMEYKKPDGEFYSFLGSTIYDTFLKEPFNNNISIPYIKLKPYNNINIASFKWLLFDTIRMLTITLDGITVYLDSGKNDDANELIKKLNRYCIKVFRLFDCINDNKIKNELTKLTYELFRLYKPLAYINMVCYSGLMTYGNYKYNNFPIDFEKCKNIVELDEFMKVYDKIKHIINSIVI